MEDPLEDNLRQEAVDLFKAMLREEEQKDALEIKNLYTVPVFEGEEPNWMDNPAQEAPDFLSTENAELVGKEFYNPMHQSLRINIIVSEEEVAPLLSGIPLSDELTKVTREDEWNIRSI